MSTRGRRSSYATAPEFLMPHAVQCHAGCVRSTHTMHAASGRGRGRAQIDVRGRGAVLTPGGAEDERAKVDRPAADVAAYEIGVHRFEFGWGRDAAREDAAAEARGEALDLAFEAVEH